MGAVKGPNLVKGPYVVLLAAANGKDLARIDTRAYYSKPHLASLDDRLDKRKSLKKKSAYRQR